MQTSSQLVAKPVQASWPFISSRAKVFCHHQLGLQLGRELPPQERLPRRSRWSGRHGRLFFIQHDVSSSKFCQSSTWKFCHLRNDSVTNARNSVLRELDFFPGRAWVPTHSAIVGSGRDNPFRGVRQSNQGHQMWMRRRRRGQRWGGL